MAPYSGLWLAARLVDICQVALFSETSRLCVLSGTSCEENSTSLNSIGEVARRYHEADDSRLGKESRAKEQAQQQWGRGRAAVAVEEQARAKASTGNPGYNLARLSRGRYVGGGGVWEARRRSSPRLPLDFEQHRGVRVDGEFATVFCQERGYDWSIGSRVSLTGEVLSACVSDRSSLAASQPVRVRSSHTQSQSHSKSSNEPSATTTEASDQDTSPLAAVTVPVLSAATTVPQRSGSLC